jgi:hypothetical protein
VKSRIGRIAARDELTSLNLTHTLLGEAVFPLLHSPLLSYCLLCFLPDFGLMYFGDGRTWSALDNCISMASDAALNARE